MKLLLTASLSMLSSLVVACPSETDMRRDAVRVLYADADIARYVCVQNEECSLDEFAGQLDIKPVSLDANATPAVQVEPRLKGHQYFSALFLQDQCKYQMVFAPDTTFSDLRMLKQQKNNFYMVRAVERDSTEAWKEYDFYYDPSARQYSLSSTRCYRMQGKKSAAIKCE